jgi:hypothetical protein
MSKLKLNGVVDDKSIKLTIELPETVNHDLVAYAEVLTREMGIAADPAKLIMPMLSCFMATDRAFSKARRIYTSRKRHPCSILLGKDARSSYRLRRKDRNSDIAVRIDLLRWPHKRTAAYLGGGSCGPPGGMAQPG